LPVTASEQHRWMMQRPSHQLPDIMLTVCLVVCVACPAITTAQKPVDTHQFGLIRHGMTEEEVLARLGPPAKITTGPYVTEAGTLDIGRQYHYPGTRQVLPTVIIFAGGGVVKKEKGASKLWHPSR
jgi:hypothetical protein